MGSILNKKSWERVPSRDAPKHLVQKWCGYRQNTSKRKKVPIIALETEGILPQIRDYFTVLM